MTTGPGGGDPGGGDPGGGAAGGRAAGGGGSPPEAWPEATPPADGDPESATAPAVPGRPAAIPVLAVLAFVLGAMAAFEALMAWPILALAPGDGAVPLRYRPYVESPAFLTAMKGAVLVRIALAALLVVSGVGLLRLRPWGRRAALAWASLRIADGVVGTVLTWTLYAPALARIAAAAGADATAAAAVRLDLVVGLPGSVCAALVHPVAVLVVLTRPWARAAFRPPAARA